MKCKNCGAELNNDKCEYCGSSFWTNRKDITLPILLCKGIDANDATRLALNSRPNYREDIFRFPMV